MNKIDEIVVSRCVDFCEMLMMLAMQDAIPALVVEAIMRLIHAKQMNSPASVKDLESLDDALIGTAMGSGYITHYMSDKANYIGCVLAIFETSLDEIKDEILQ